MGATVAAFLEITSPGGQTLARWQSRWQGLAVTWQGQAWAYTRFEWAGDVSGGTLSESQATLALPMLGEPYSVLRDAAAVNGRGLLKVYHYADDLSDANGPPAEGMVLVGQIAGLVGIASVSTTAIGVTLDSGEVRGSGTFPPRSADVGSIGVPCVLEVS